MGVVRDAFLDALGEFTRLVERDEVAERWDEPSCLPDYTIGALVGHVYSTAAAIERYLETDEPPDASSPKGAYYAPVPSPADGADLHDGIRARGAEIAQSGRDAVVEKLRALSERLRTRLEREPSTRRVAVMGWVVLTIDDYLETRVLELVIHSDDLGVSIGVAPDLSSDALAVTVTHLVEIARERHGDLAVIRALARRERDAVDAAHVL